MRMGSRLIVASAIGRAASSSSLATSRSYGVRNGSKYTATDRKDGTTSRTPEMFAACTASANATVRALTMGSIRSSNSTTRAESPAGTIRHRLASFTARGAPPPLGHPSAHSPRAGDPAARARRLGSRLASLRRVTPTRRPRWGPRRLARAAGAERLKKFLMDAAEAAVRHEDDQVAGPMLARDGLDDVVDRLRLARLLTAAVEIADELRNREPLRLRELRSENRRNQHFVGAGERAGEVVLKHAAARRGRSRLEDGPDPRRRMRGAHAGDRLGDRGRMMREIVVHRDAVRRADHFEPPLDAGKQTQPFGDPLGADANVGRDRHGRQRIPHVVRADEWHVEQPKRRAAATDLEPRRRTRRFEIVRLPVDPVSHAEGLDPRAGRVGQGGRARAG